MNDSRVEAGGMLRTEGPFGPATHLESVPVSSIIEMYLAKCNYDPTPHFGDLRQIELYECQRTGMRFWRPEEIAGSEDFYRELSAAWVNYYQEWRWEYDIALQHIKGRKRLVEIGCGRGYFLKATEGLVPCAKGLELNKEAISNRVTHWEIEASTIESLGEREPAAYDIVCSFQVLEHVVDPRGFIEASIACLMPDGLLIYSVPNPIHPAHRLRLDAFDLPPHHVNHFTEDAFSNIADHFGIRLIQVRHQPTRRELATRGSPKTAILNLIKRALNYYYAVTRAPGHTILAIFQV